MKKNIGWTIVIGTLFLVFGGIFALAWWEFGILTAFVAVLIPLIFLTLLVVGTAIIESIE